MRSVTATDEVVLPAAAVPLRGGLLGADRLAASARALARDQKWTCATRESRTPLLDLLAIAERELATVYRRLAADVHENIPVSPAAEWLLDNYYLIEEQIRLVRDDLPAHYGAELPRLSTGDYRLLPRVFEMMVTLVSHTDSRIDQTSLESFTMAYQDASPLTIGEVWAVPIMLRITLVENLRRLALRVLDAHQSVVAGDRFADRLLAAGDDGPEAVAARITELDLAHAEAPAPFIVRLSQRLAGQDVALAPLADWLETTLAARGVTLEQVTLAAHQEQAADQVSVANAITSVRFLDALEWRDFFEHTSLVEHVLREDPAGTYARMDFRSRDRYRHAIESIARRCPLDEIGIAEAAMSHALDALAKDPADAVRGHVGHYLISSGRYAFEQAIGYRPHLKERLYRGPLAARGLVFWGLFALVTVALAAGVSLFAWDVSGSVGVSVVLALLALLPVSDVALTIVNRVSAWLWPARTLPKIDYRKPVSPAHRTMVVYTALLTSPQSAQHVIDNMEIGYLANTDPNIRFGILADLRGAAEQRLPGDAAVIEAARHGIAVLNHRYGRLGSRPFSLFVRGRTYSEADRTWMGWERKRGALTEFCRLLRGATDTSFEVVDGDAAGFHGMTFLVTLDTDTVLPRDGARKLISTIAHPLNRAELDPGTRTVRRGYGLVQPRVAMSLEGSTDSLFAWVYSGVTGIDPYAGAVSDTYQDVFGEGSFTGKGIFEIDIFNAALDERFPENTLLSHDLLEGSYLRTALASDVEVLDDQPASYISHCARLHRWVRGDWQTIPWLLPRVPVVGGTERTPLTGLHRWKIADNLRRSLSAPVMMLFATAGFMLLPHAGWAWLGILFGLLFFPLYFQFADSVVFRRPPADTRSDTTTFVSDLKRDVLRNVLNVAVLPHQAYLMTDAIVRACWRIAISHRNLLEWETAAEAERRLGTTDLGAFVKRMWPATAITALLAAPVALGAAGPRALLSAAPLFAVWLTAPLAAWRASRPTPEPESGVVPADVAAMRRIARKTWRFFETFVTAESNRLAPDNFQEEPKGEVAHRTSPTNMGLQLISYMTAHDLGYVTVAGLVGHVSRTLHTMAGMERFRGHFYNWYDTLTLQPLRPTYVSTVDSGNLAGHLLTLRVGLLEASERELLGPQTLDGIADTARLALEGLQRARRAPHDGPALSQAHTALEEIVRRISLDSPPENLGEWLAALEGLSALADALPASLKTPDGEPPGEPAHATAGAALDDLRAAIAAPLGLIADLAPWARDVLAAAGTHAGRPDGALAPLIGHVPSLVGLAEGLAGALAHLDEMASGDGPDAGWAERVADGIRRSRTPAAALLAELRLAADIAREMWEHTDFAMLYDERRMLFSIGFNAAEGRLDDSYYDMLASECRLASFLAVAKGDVGQEHWFRLGRAITRAAGGTALVSWSASMFEYLMPLLVMKSWPDTLLHRTYVSVVRRQIQYGRQRGVPWGVSESAFNAKDVELTYQYQAFGVPGLGLKRGLSADVVIAPYATVLALMVAPRDALDNLAEIARQGGEGRYGYYEAIDYTPGRVPAGRERAIVKAYMAHHQGMSLVALGNMLTDFRMQERFHADPLVASAELLLQERVPRRIQLATPRVEEVEFVRSVREVPPPVTRAYPLADTPVPATHFLSNGTYSVMVTNGGGGYSRWKDRTVTRYREDLTRDCWGTFLYLKDVESGRVWSAAFQPTLAEPDDYHVTFSADKADFRRYDGEVETHTEVIVSPEDDVEVRRLTVTNHGTAPLALEVTSYLEVNLAPLGADHAHKAYSNLFVQTEAIDEYHALLFTRRPRSDDEPRYWGLHMLACESIGSCSWSYETDRAAFLGRLRTPVDASAIHGDGRLTQTTGAVLDPMCSIRQPLVIEAGQSAHLAYVTGAAKSREEVMALAEKYSDIANAQRAADLAWSTSQIELRDLGITPEESVTFLRLASRLLLTDPHSRLKVMTDVENRLPASGLWPIGISGDDPILLVKIERLEEAPLVRQTLLAHQYWRSKGFVCDLVILNIKPSAYSSELDGRLRMLMRTGHALQLADRPGGVHLRNADHMQPDVLNLLTSMARVVITGDSGPITLQLNQRAQHPDLPDPFVPTHDAMTYPDVPRVRPELLYDNGLGGFDPVTGEYVIVLEGGRTTPAPWVNVIATPHFGTLVSEAGIGCTWAENSHENRITTWNNDPVSDGTGECIYVRDEATGQFWSPTPLPVHDDGTYIVRHGKGYSRFEHDSHGIGHELDWFVAAEDPVRIARLRLTNTGTEARRLSVTHNVEWSLGDSRSKAQQRVVTWWDESAGVLMAHSWFNMDFPGRPAFLASDGELHSFTASRTEFIGRNGTPTAPAAMRRRGLGGQTGRFHDNCGALMRIVELQPGESRELVFLLGQTETVEAAHAVVDRLRQPGAAGAELESVKGAWRELLTTVEVQTPDRALDLMVNGQALYQSLACRVWGRTATYQSSGAYGFRDQLQDCLALIDIRPDLVREHIIEASRHQFPEGDVLHWWQPISGRGVRTHISDDRHWLPFVTAEYVRATGDTSVLDVETPYLEGPPIPDGREDLYLQPNPSLTVATLYDHCLGALDHAPLGERGLPLMGGGDWNDGMNRVGIGGHGESVWMAWFLDVVMRSFAGICDQRGDAARAISLRERAAALVAAIERSGWDGSWYRRAYFDDGTPLGSSESAECRIDAIAQAWSVLSGQGDPERARRAMESVEEQLVRWDDGLIKLLTPPFDLLEHDPGYIKGYVPGVRENGGQYTHAALWVALAYARLGDGDEAHSLLSLINPIRHALDAAAVERYHVEPYVVAADVYAVEPHVGRGGWTWYTGSAAWFYRVAVRELLGLRTESDGDGRWLIIDPCVPKTWTSFRLTYRSGDTRYDIAVENPRGANRGVAHVTLDGTRVDDCHIPLLADGATHEVTVSMIGG
ncbi:MAG: glucoamylase family protein [Coriobacteriia bacterium]|nr:glucoamylase family protein [Coriobacteriia bacterium]